MTSSLAPFLIFYIGAVLAGATDGRLRAAIMLAVPVVGALNLWGMADGNAGQLALFDYTLTFIRVDKLSVLFGYLFHLAAFLGIVFSLHVKDRVQHVAGLAYAGSALGAIYAGDLITLFLFWEMLALTSVFLILARGTERATRAAMRYFLIQVLSGVVLLAGVIIHAGKTGSIAFDFIGLDGLGSWLIFLGFAVKCAFPVLHTWLTDAYPEATPTGTVLLSAFTTKVAVYAMARGFPGTEILVYAGATMAMFPIFFAVIENDLRRVLAYSLINQVGFMVCGIGIGTALAINGAVSHAFNDVIFKGLLFMTMGAVLHRTGKMNGSDLGGLYKSMPWTTGFCIVGAASISAFPLFSGFVSKSMVMVAALEEGHPIVWLCLLFASAGVFHHAGIKIPYFAFFAHDSGIRCKEAPRNMLIAMGLSAAICIFNGSYPWVLYSMLPFPVDYEPYTLAHILTQSQLLFFSALAFVWLQLRGLYPPELPSVNIDTDWSYRKLLPAAAIAVRTLTGNLVAAMRDWTIDAFSFAHHKIYRLHGPEGVLASSWPTGSMAFWTAVLLLGYLLVNYFS
ncbi:MAG: Na(+)/H(+) antiporter subunit D [Hyphomicrobiales bacterium]|nr:Na(+)/H(+) antiporter subunit D [Hyphomicrobiales bacterium]